MWLVILSLPCCMQPGSKSTCGGPGGVGVEALPGGSLLLPPPCISQLSDSVTCRDLGQLSGRPSGCPWLFALTGTTYRTSPHSVSSL